MQQCQACGATYAPIQADGTEYYHTCPDFSDADVAAQLGLPDDPTMWTEAERRAFEAAPKARPNKRDENVIPSHAANAKRAIKLHGDGAVDVK